MTESWQNVLTRSTAGKHAVQYYTDDVFLARMIGFFAAEGLPKNENTVIICTKSHAPLFEKAIHKASDRPASELKSEGKLLILDAEDTLARFMVNGMPDRHKFNAVIRPVLKKMGANGKVRAYGEMVDILWHKGQREAALLLEDHWNELLEEGGFFLLCAYSVDNLSAELYDSDFERVCHTHDTILPAQEPEKFHKAVSNGLKKIGEPLSWMVTTLAGIEDRRETVSADQKQLLWLSKHMPLTAKKILAPAGEKLKAS